MSRYPPQNQYPPPPQSQAYPPPNSAYPPPNSAYPPPNSAYPPPNSAYPPSGYPPPHNPAYPPTALQSPPLAYNTSNQGNLEGFANRGYDASREGQPSNSQGRRPRTEMSTSAWDDENSFAGESFNSKKIRMAFIRKVYSILTVQLLFTCAVIFFVVLHQPTQQWVSSHSWVYYPAYGVFLITYIVLVCCEKVRRKWPVNFICLAIFTIALTYMAATISSFYNIMAVGITFGITALVCVSVSIFACQTKFDFTKCGGCLCVCLLVFVFFGFACMIVYLVAPGSFAANVLQCVYGGVGALLFTAFLAFDTQMLIGGKKHELSEEEHIYAALQLYVDVVYIFLLLLGLFGGGSD